MKETFKSTIELIGDDRPGILADVSISLSNMRVPIHTLIAKELKDSQSSIQVTIGITGLDQLNSIITNLKKIPGVQNIRRATQ